MPEAKIQHKEKIDKIIRTGIFSIAAVTAITILITWFGKERQFDILEQDRFSKYSGLSVLVGKIIGVSSSDSLANWAGAFNHNFYDAENIATEDSLLLLAMRRFKFELNDRLNGAVNILDPDRFEKTGQDIIEACQLQIAKMNKIPKQPVQKYYSATSAYMGK
jgi:hypothetical protein